MSPRKFEEFIGDLFRAQNYEVELTQQTRDDGVDILFVKKLLGNNIRFAVEVKRYTDSRKISASMIRSFVGANERYKADRLIYVTTSSYTKPAKEFAERYCSHILSLKNYDQVMEWCEIVSDQENGWQLLGF